LVLARKGLEYWQDYSHPYRQLAVGIVGPGREATKKFP
jgi:hypothetical protein